MAQPLDPATLAKHVIWATGTRVSCSVTELLGVLTSTNIPDAVLMQAAGVIKMRGMPRSQEYLAHYLNGSGITKNFMLAELLQDPGASNVVKSGLKTSLVNRNVITIRQGDFTSEDWKFSLGTYFIYFIEAGNFRNSTGRETRHVLAWGEDTYRWHPDDDKRYTQCVHRAAERLRGQRVSGVQRASNFKMNASPVLIEADTGNVNLIAQFRPSPQLEAARARVQRQMSIPMCR